MSNWLAFRELFACVAVVVVIGVMIGTLIMRDQYTSNEHDKISVSSYEPLPGLVNVKWQSVNHPSGQKLDEGFIFMGDMSNKKPRS